MSFNERKTIKSTRKEHRCHGCLQSIKKGSEAINDKGYNDGWYSGYLHKECADVAAEHFKLIDPFGDGMPEGAILELEDFFGEKLVPHTR